jgi:hypothetical protein
MVLIFITISDARAKRHAQRHADLEEEMNVEDMSAMKLERDGLCERMEVESPVEVLRS